MARIAVPRSAPKDDWIVTSHGHAPPHPGLVGKDSGTPPSGSSGSASQPTVTASEGSLVGGGATDGASSAAVPVDALAPIGSVDSIALLFWRAPLTVTSGALVSSPVLNRARQSLAASDRQVLDALVSRNLTAIRDFMDSDASRRHSAVDLLRERGLLREVAIDDFSPEVASGMRRDAEKGSALRARIRGKAPIGDPLVAAIAQNVRLVVPDARCISIVEGRVFVATGAQLVGYDDPVDFRIFLQGGFLNECLSFFVERGLLGMDEAGKCVERFHGMSR